MTEQEPESPPLPYWISEFLSYTEGIPSPDIFRKWVAIATIAGALERRTFLWTAKRLLFPNLFILLVGPPGVGKSVAIEEAQDLWAAAGKFNVAPGSMTGKGVVDQLQSEDGVRSYFDAQGNWQYFHSMLIPAPEFGTLVQGQDLAQLSILNALYDCGPMYEERTRGLGLISIEKPHISLVAGTQPSYLGEIFPESAYGMGFTSRIIMVYSAEPKKTQIFSDEERDAEKKSELVAYLREVADLNGQFVVEDEARNEIEDWWSEGCPPAPDHTKLVHYGTRRIAHCLKLCMAISVARNMELVITQEDFHLAQSILLEAEETMPEIFKEISSSSDHSTLEETLNFIWQEYFNNGRNPVKEHRIIQFLQERIPVYKTNDIIEGLINGGRVEKKPGPPGKRQFKPLGY